MPDPVQPHPLVTADQFTITDTNLVKFKGHTYHVTFDAEDGKKGRITDPAQINEIIQILLASQVSAKTDDLSKTSITKSGVEIAQDKAVEKITDEALVNRINTLFKTVFPEVKNPEPRAPQSVSYPPLKNFGVSCFYNASLQLLLSTRPNIEKYLKRSEENGKHKGESDRAYQIRSEAIKRLRAFFHAVDQKADVEKALASLWTIVSRLGQEFSDQYRMQDAPAFIQLVLHSIGALTPAHFTYNGTGVDQIPQTTTSDEFGTQMIIPIIPGRSLQQSLMAVSRYAEDREINDVPCQKCTSTERIGLDEGQPPEYVYLQLERFRAQEENGEVKISKNPSPVDFTGAKGNQFDLKKIIVPTDKDCTYELVGIVNHIGKGTEGGHYVAKVKDDKGQWFLCNDEAVTKLDPVNPFTADDQKEVYMLALRRVNS